MLILSLYKIIKKFQILKFWYWMPGPSSRKRAYRQNVKCSLCLKEVQEDNFRKHKDKMHLTWLSFHCYRDLQLRPPRGRTLEATVDEVGLAGGFSTLKRLKTFIRSTMGEERLNSLAVLNIHREICNLVMEKDTDKLVNKFSEGQGRSMYFFWMYQ